MLVVSTVDACRSSSLFADFAATCVDAFCGRSILGGSEMSFSGFAAASVGIFCFHGSVELVSFLRLKVVSSSKSESSEE